MIDYDPDTRPTIACPNPKCGHSIVIPPLLGELGARHPKWQRVEPGTVIPAGQPYRHETPNSVGLQAREQISTHEVHPQPNVGRYFIDSSWKPPLVLPTAPCVIKARIWGGLVHTLYGHFEDDEKQTGVVFCRAADGMTVKADDIVSFEVLWTEGV